LFLPPPLALLLLLLLLPTAAPRAPALRQRKMLFLPPPLALLLLLLLLPTAAPRAPAVAKQAAEVAEVAALLGRISPAFDLAAAVDLRIVQAGSGGGFFEIAAPDRGGEGGFAAKITAGNAVDLAAGAHWWLKYHLNCSVSWWGDQLDALPAPGTPLPAFSGLERHTTTYDLRYYMNVCTFGYSTAFWDWARWEREIDWMALNGINTPLAFVGQEYVFREVLREVGGLSDADIGSFFSGPAVLPWMRMGNLQSWLGELPEGWIDTHHDLQNKILERMRSLGMTPVLPAFSGLVPDGMKQKFPDSNFTQSSGWNGLPSTTFLAPTDALFSKLGAAYVAKQIALYNGTDHLYNCDLYNEMLPPSNSPAYLASATAGVYAALAEADPRAIWVMQGWLFHSRPEFWQETQMKALLHAVPHGKLLVLDLYSEDSPVWSRTDSYYGTPFIWNMLHNFGGRSGMFARLTTIANAADPKSPAFALAANATATPSNQGGQLRGLGLTPEAIETNPIVYDLMMENVWRGTDGVTDLDAWVDRYAERRYGLKRADLQKGLLANRLLQNSVYDYHESTTDKQGTSGSIFAARPASVVPKVSCCDVTTLYYNASDVVKAWRLLVGAVADAPQLAHREAFLYDLVVCGVQALSNLALQLHADVVASIGSNNLTAFDKASGAFLSAANGADSLLMTKQQFLLGKWVASAKSWAESPPGAQGVCSAAGQRTPCGEEAISMHDCELLMCCFDVEAGKCFKADPSDYLLYEQNAKTLVTLWGPFDTHLHDYSYRLWADLVGSFYVPRWVQWFRGQRKALVDGKPYDQLAFDLSIELWEESWALAPTNFTTETTGDAVEISEALLKALFVPERV
jgi:alpha-N-acetylglucosaminidase